MENVEIKIEDDHTVKIEVEDSFAIFLSEDDSVYDEDLDNDGEVADKDPLMLSGSKSSEMSGDASTNHTSTNSSKTCTFNGCRKVFRRPSHLKQHMRIHTGERLYECPVSECGRSYMRRQHLKRHIEISHLGTAPEQKSKCEECGKLFSNVYSLKKHHQRYHERQMFTCDQCGRPFRKQQHLKTHSFVHTGVKPYACDHPGCEMRCETPSRLKRHKNIHQKNRYTCPQDACNTTFDQFRDLRRHFSLTHPKVCDVCGKSFKELRYLRKHRQTHEDTEDESNLPFLHSFLQILSKTLNQQAE